MHIAFEVEGLPGPQGSKSFKGLTPAGKPRMIEASAKVKPWRKRVHEAAEVAMRATPEWEQDYDGPVYVQMTFWMPRPQSAPKRARLRMFRLPDLSKLVRSTEDAITTSGLWHDDARVTRMLVEKRYAIGPDLPAIHRPGEDRALPGARIEIDAMSYAEPRLIVDCQCGQKDMVPSVADWHSLTLGHRVRVHPEHADLLP